MLVSVVIPTWNAGPYLDAAIESLVSQTLPADQFEIIVVDDGSTDDTPAHIDAMAARHPNLTAIHSAHSGWPGRPRNIGIEHASGEYIHFMDQDDRMSPDALRRLVEMAKHNDSDIVLGKVASDFRGVALAIYRRNLDSCSIHDAPIIRSLTPHKLFRRAFLDEHMLRFPEGRRRLEDQLFVVKAYFAAAVISILGDEPCYFYLGRSDGRNAGNQHWEPDSYYANLREVLDVIVVNTEPGPQRARLLRRFVGNELIGRLSGQDFLDLAADVRQRAFVNVRDILRNYVDPADDAALGAITRLRVGIVRADRPADLVELASRLAGLQLRSQVHAVRWSKERWRIRFSADIEDGGGRPLRCIERGGRTYLDPVFLRGITTDPLDVSDDLASLRLRIAARDHSSSVEWHVPARVSMAAVVLPEATAIASDAGSAEGDVRIRLRGLARLATETGAAGRPIDVGMWQLNTRISAFGVDLRGRLGDAPRRPGTVDRFRPRIVGDERLVSLRVVPGEGTTLRIEHIDAWRKALLTMRLAAGRLASGLVRRGRRLGALFVDAEAPGA